MMPGVTISCVFSEQMPLVNCTSPLENKLSGALKPFKDASHRLFVEIRAANLPGSARSDLLAFEEAGLGQPLDRAVTHAAYTARFAQAHSFGIEQRSSLARNRVNRGMHFTPDYPTSCGWPVRLPRRCWTISE